MHFVYKQTVSMARANAKEAKTMARKFLPKHGFPTRSAMAPPPKLTPVQEATLVATLVERRTQQQEGEDTQKVLGAKGTERGVGEVGGRGKGRTKGKAALAAGQSVEKQAKLGGAGNIGKTTKGKAGSKAAAMDQALPVTVRSRARLVADQALQDVTECTKYIMSLQGRELALSIAQKFTEVKEVFEAACMLVVQ